MVYLALITSPSGRSGVVECDSVGSNQRREGERDSIGAFWFYLLETGIYSRICPGASCEVGIGYF